MKGRRRLRSSGRALRSQPQVAGALAAIIRAVFTVGFCLLLAAVSMATEAKSESEQTATTPSASAPAPAAANSGRRPSASGVPDAAPEGAAPKGSPAVPAAAANDASAASSASPRPGSSPIPGDGAEVRFRRAGSEYEAGHYQEAAALYESLLSEGYDDARIYYNLGNTRFKQSRLGPANLAYERALVRDPTDADARENLAYANQLIADKVGATEEDFAAALLAAFERRIGSDACVLALAILSALCGLAALPLWFSSSPLIRMALKASLGILIPLAGLALVATVLVIAQPGRVEHAIVLADSADGRSAPSNDGTVLFTVHEGLKVEIRGAREGWIQVVLPNGLTGWIESSRVERI